MITTFYICIYLFFIILRLADKARESSHQSKGSILWLENSKAEAKCKLLPQQEEIKIWFLFTYKFIQLDHKNETVIVILTYIHMSLYKIIPFSSFVKKAYIYFNLLSKYMKYFRLQNVDDFCYVKNARNKWSC